MISMKYSNMLLAKSLTGEEVAHQLIVCLSTELGIKPELLVSAMRDHASVNSVAMRTLSIVFPNVLDIGCFSHTLDYVGENFKTPILDEFIKVWINMFSRSPKTKLVVDKSRLTCSNLFSYSLVVEMGSHKATS